MAEINMPQKSGRSKKHPPRIDLTPMVDLGFLLITFFMFTTTMAKPNVMDIRMPTDEHPDRPQTVIAESTITVIPVKGHEVVYYEGILEDASQLKMCKMANVREVLVNKKKHVIALPASFSRAAHKMYVLIKPNDDSKYEDLVNLLDEMNIVDVPNYCIMDVTAEEKALIKNKF